jgi:hypothetical protein
MAKVGHQSKWIEKSIPKSHRGVFKKKAQRAGMTTREYAVKERGAPGKLGEEARESLTLMGMRKGKRKG